MSFIQSEAGEGTADPSFDSDDQNSKLISVFDLENVSFLVHNVKVQIKYQ